MTTATSESQHATRSGPTPHDRGQRLVDIEGTSYYVVEDVDRMPPFLMSIVSDGDRWMFLSSGGGLTAGRWDAAHALFPYETDDRLHLLSGLSGSVTGIRPGGARPDEIWRPMVGQAGVDRRRTLYKAVVGDAAIFEETDAAAGLRFSYRWASGERYGFIRTASITNEGSRPVTIDILDGMRNILPHGLDPSIYLPMSNLANAYKRSEVIDDAARLAVYSLESLVTDQTEPAQALRATVAWSAGLPEASVSLRPDAVRIFESGSSDLDGDLVTGLPGAYFLRATVDLEPGETRTWHIAADVGLDQPGVSELRHELQGLRDPERALEASIAHTGEALVGIMARADAEQSTGDEIATAHHFSNVTYNVMRGGIPMDGYSIDVPEFIDYLSRRNATVAARHGDTLVALGETVNRADLLRAVADSDDVDLVRLSHDYLPFSFSRRHGDPSRPWNAFSIRVSDADGNPVNYYEGNWRDIFQNWEATAMSFPEYLTGMVSVFVNASTPDGFNPYRITSDGIDWEVPDPDDPWSNIGYWGDHQITYLLRLLEASDRYEPGEVARLLSERRYTYANVPYRIVPYDQLLSDPKSTIDYDEDAVQVIEQRVGDVGADGRLVWDGGSPYHVTLAEKLLVPALTKLSNFVPDGGIWMNTQRPEWNDANNALVGYGISMVTLYQLRRYLDYLRTLVTRAPISEVEMSFEVADWLGAIITILRDASVEPGSATQDDARKQLVDALGAAFTAYRSRCYDGFSGMMTVRMDEISALCDIGLAHLDQTIRSGRRADGLYDSYNVMRVTDDGAAMVVERLGEMLEGQVAAIESGALAPDECADVVDALFDSAMYRPDQNSFMLYPARHLPSFLDRNVVPSDAVTSNPLLTELLAGADTSIVVSDIDGTLRFSATLDSRDTLEATLEQLAADPNLRHLVDEHGSSVIGTYEEVFGYREYTGRSGSMYGYEGIGSIYWHMVAKLLVALQDAAFRARAAGSADDAVDRLRAAYWRVRSGMGFNKTPTEHGAIPIDPYSHTPSHAGAQQPGMTGLVKEELLVRPAELGVLVTAGEIRFDDLFVASSEARVDDKRWTTLDVSLNGVVTDVPAAGLGLTVCQVPIVVELGADEPHIEVDFSDATTEVRRGATLGRSVSGQIFARTGEVTRVRAKIPTHPT